MPETPDWHTTPAPCPNCPQPWHALPAHGCETSALAPVVITPAADPLRWEGDDA